MDSDKSERAGKAMTLRLADEQAEMLALVAAVEDKAISAVVREAIDAYLDHHLNSPTFKESAGRFAAKVSALSEDHDG